MLLFQSKVHGAYLALRARLDREEGQALVEYALILGLIAVFAIGALQLLGTNVSSVLQTIADDIGGAL